MQVSKRVKNAGCSQRRWVHTTLASTCGNAAYYRDLCMAPTLFPNDELKSIRIPHASNRYLVARMLNWS